jgi:hypothetical protein
MIHGVPTRIILCFGIIFGNYIIYNILNQSSIIVFIWVKAVRQLIMKLSAFLICAFQPIDLIPFLGSTCFLVDPKAFISSAKGTSTVWTDGILFTDY